MTKIWPFTKHDEEILRRGDPLEIQFAGGAQPFEQGEVIHLAQGEIVNALTPGRTYPFLPSDMTEARVILAERNQRGWKVVVTLELLTPNQERVLADLLSLGLIFRPDYRTLLSICEGHGLNPESDTDLAKIVPLELTALQEAMDELSRVIKESSDGQ